MLLRPRRPPPLAPPSPTDSVAELLPPAEDAPGTPPRGPAAPEGGSPGWPGAPVSPGSAQRAPWSAWETELLLAELLRPAVWRALLLDRRRALPTYRRVSAALALRQVRRTPAQCRRRYKFLKNKVREAAGQPPGPFDAQIRELMGLLGDDRQAGRARRRPAGPGRPQRGRRPAPSAPAPAPDEPGAAPPRAPADPEADADPAAAPEPSLPRAADRGRAAASPPPPAAASARRTPDPEPGRSPGSPSPGLPADLSPPPAAAPSLNAALLQTLTHLGDIVAVLGPLRDQLLTLNQHVEQLRGSFDQTVSLAVGFILGSAAAERGVLGEPS
ncbi:undifferentiated embryonic cell transcription factor 1 [Dipodomys spectabilis]|uniref:undifferentiated embryonic cell transcription factor 1 n=1 Tax=Dipodomys spectabilis TaxID=105255 RepID=UPI001C542C97|nr:undifferentiated embryonic cell transcription factor 1 [Dipodomys spectabilis]